MANEREKRIEKEEISLDDDIGQRNEIERTGK